jgi:hypothetical protein
LPEPEQSLLRQLAVFVGGVPVEGAVAVMRGAGYSEASATESLANLVEKSLAVRDQSAPAGRLQLLETIRAYALEKLVERGEAEHASRRHAEFFSGLFGSAGAVSQLRPSTENMARFEREIDNIRAALHWSFSPAGHAETGVILTAHCALLWLHSTLLSECADRAERALQPMTAGMQLGDALRMQLHLALGVSLGLTMGDVDRTKAALVQAIELGERLDDRQVQLRGLWALWALHINIGQARAAQTVVEQFSSVAGRADDRAALLTSVRTMRRRLAASGCCGFIVPQRTGTMCWCARWTSTPWRTQCWRASCGTKVVSTKRQSMFAPAWKKRSRTLTGCRSAKFFAWRDVRWP